MADIAQLGIAVDTSQTKLAARELDNLAAAGAKAEGSTKKLGSTSKQAMEQAAAATAKAQQTMERMLAAQERQEKLMEQMAREMQHLTQALQGNASANNAAAQAAQNAAQALGQESAAAKSAQAAAQGHAQAATSAAAASGAMGAQATATGSALGGMASKVLATATAVLSLGKIISEMDAWTNMNNRIRLVTEGQEQFATAQANIISIAKSTNQPLAETAELYQRLAMNQKALGLSGTELSGIVKTISQTMVISGSSAAGAAAALMQLGQAFNSGVLRGEEFNSVMEQAPGLMQAIASGMGKTVGEMRALAEAGKITTDELVKALQKQAATVDADYGKMSKTVEQSMTNVKTSFTEFVGRADEATGVSKALSTAINGVAENIGPLATIAATLVGVGLATWIGSAAAASGGLAVALGGVAAASTGLLAAMGPAGWLILGVGAAATAWQLLGSKASTAGAQMSSAGEQAAAAGNKLVAGIVPAINTAIGAYDKMIAKQKESMGIAKTPIDDAAKALKEADLNLQKLAQQVARAQQGGGEYVNMGPKQRAAAEKALTDELEKASKKRGELAAKEAEYNANVVTQYVKGKERQTEASEKLLKIEEAKGKRDTALAAASGDRAKQDAVNAAYRIELAKIEESSSKKAASAVSAATRETNKALKEQNNAYADLAGVSSTYYKEMESYQAQRAKGNITEAQYVELVEKLIQKQPFAVALTKAQTQAFKEQEDARKKAYEATEKAYQSEVDAAQKSAKAAQEKVGQLSDEAQAIEISKEKHITLAEAMEEVIVKRLEDQLESAKQAGNQELLDAIADEIKARKELGQALGDREVREAADDAAQDAAKSWKATADKINNDLTDAIIAGFEGGKNGAQALKDSLVKMFNDMVLRPVISAIVAPVSGMLSSGAQAAGGAAAGGGIGSIGSSISTAISNGFSSFAMSSTGQKLGLSSVGADGMGPPSLSSTGQGMSTAMGVVGDTLAGYAMGSMARSLISGGYSVSKGTDTFQKVGVAVGSALGGPVMGAIIGASTGVFNRAFGRKLADLGVEAKFGGEQNFSGNQYKFEKGGWFRSDKTTREPMSQEMADAFEERFNGIRVSMGFMATTLGVSADSVAEFTRDVKLSFMGLDEDQVVEKIDEMFANMSDDMAASILGVSQTTTTTVKEMQAVVTVSGDDMVTSFIEVEKQVTQTTNAQSEYAKSGETHTQTLIRLSSSLITVNGVFDTLGTTLYETSLKGGDMASKLLDAFGGESNFTNFAASYYDNYYSEEEKRNTLLRQTTAALSEQNLTLPKTKEEYRNLVEAQDLTTEAGRANYAVLLKNAGAFAELTPAASAANKQITGLNKMFAGLGVNTKLAETKFDKATKEMFESLGVSVEDYSNSIADVIAGIATGKIPAEDAGAELANAAVGGITNAIAQGASQAIAAQFVNSIITPIIANIMAGNEALAGINLEAGLADLQTGATALGTVLQQIGPTIGGIAADAAAIISGSVAGVQGATAGTGSSGDGYTPGLFAIGGSAVPDRPYQSPAFEAFGNLANETIESNKKVSELLQKLLNPKKEYANRYLELADKLLQKQADFGLEAKKTELANLKLQLTDIKAISAIVNPLIDSINTGYYQIAGGMSNKSPEFDRLADLLISRGKYDETTGMLAGGNYVGKVGANGATSQDVVSNFLEDFFAEQNNLGNQSVFSNYLKAFLGITDFSGLDLVTDGTVSTATENLTKLEKELREWYIAQARVIAVEDYATNLEETAAAKSKTAELKRTGGLEDPVTNLKEQFAAKMQAIDDGIGAALMAEVDGLRGQTASESVLNPIKLALSQKNQLLETLSGDTSGWQASVEKSIQDDENFLSDFSNWETMTAPIMSGVADRQAANKSLLESLKDGSLLTKTESEITALEDQMTAAMLAATDPEKQQDLLDEIAKYKGGITEWFEAQAELLSTEMLVDINKQIAALEAEEKGPLTTIKDAIQKYMDDFTELGTLNDEAKAKLEKLSGLQLTNARKQLYDQLLTPEEITANSKAKLQTDFGDVISGALTSTFTTGIEAALTGMPVEDTSSLVTLLQGVGEEMPTTTAGFRALIDSIDTSTTAGQNLRDSLLELVPGFVSLQGAADGATDTLTPLEEVEKAFGALERAINAEKETLREAFDARMDVLQKELAIAQERAGIENQAIKLLGRSKELRAAELAAMDASNRGLKQRIWAVEDASENVDKALSTLQRSVAAQKASVSESAQSQIDAINAGAEARQKAVDDAQQSVQDLTGIFDEITNAVKTLRGNAQEEAMRMEQARAYISMALSVAQAGGAVDQKRLSDAMATVTSDTAETYAAGADYRFAQARQAAELQKLADVTGGKKDVAQATLDAALAANQTAQDQIKAITEARDSQLKALDNQLKTAQDAVSVMRGVDLSVLGVGDAVTALDTAMAAYEVERARLGAEQLFTGQIQVTLLEKQIEQEQANFDAQIEALDSQLEIAQSQLDALRGVDNSVQSLAAAMSAFASAQAAASAAAKAAAATPASGGAITYDGPQGTGTYVNGGITGGVRPKPVPSYDIGTNYVPRDTLAMVHEGEAIVPKAFNPAAFGGAKSDDGQLASLVVSLTAEVQRLQGIVQAGNAEQRRTADAVNGRPEAPMLVETV